jgi:glycosyltransferase involved in cell wall biosynthesis
MTTPAILTNMMFWQSPLWTARTDSIYPQGAQQEFAPLKTAWTLFRKRRAYDVVLTMGVRESMAYALLCAVTGQDSRQIMAEVFVDAPQPDRWQWRSKTRFYRWLCGRARGMLTNSSYEINALHERFGIPLNALRFVPLAATVAPQRTAEAEPLIVLSAGRTLRDYDMLIEVSRHLDAPLTIVCGDQDLRDTELPPGVTVHRELARTRYLELLRTCAVVLLPLRPTQRATGQVVLLEAMAYGKPVVTTRSPGTQDYIAEGEDGYMVAPGDVAQMVRHTRALLADRHLRQHVGRAARERIHQAHQPDHYAQNALTAIGHLTLKLP